jgi:hypothetical protein
MNRMLKDGRRAKLARTQAWIFAESTRDVQGRLVRLCCLDSPNGERDALRASSKLAA